MDNHLDAAGCHNAVMDMIGVDAFKEVIRKLHDLPGAGEPDRLPRLLLPNYLWAVQRGGGVTKMLSMFAEYLHAARLMEFRGLFKFFEYELHYVPPDFFFTELGRFHSKLDGLARHSRYFKGVACIHIDDWLKNTDDPHFIKFLHYLSDNSNRLISVFCAHTTSEPVISALEAALGAHMRIETLMLRFPEPPELVNWVENRSLLPLGFSLEEDARSLLVESVAEIATGKQFHGFKTIVHLAEDILYRAIAHEKLAPRPLTADLLRDFAKGSPYVQRAKRATIFNPGIGYARG